MSRYHDAIFELLASEAPRGLQPAELTRALGLDRGRSTEIRDVLQQLVRAGLVVRDGRRYALRPGALPSSTAEPRRDAPAAPGPAAGTGADGAGEVRGLLRVSSRGRGALDRGEAYEALTIYPEDLGPAIDGDTVVAVLERRRRGERARVLRVVERGRTRVTGTLRGPPWRLELDDPRLQSPTIVEHHGGGRDGEAVLAEIVGYPERPGDALRLKVTRRLGQPGDLLTEVAKVLAAEGVQEAFPQQVASAAEQQRRVPGAAERADREDLRDLHFVTIDPLTARDFDDAVAVEPRAAGGARVWVAVADVTHYVTEGSAIDAEARHRGCSLYLPDRAIPMLPAALSSDLCSLRPREDRLAMVVRLDVDAQGEVQDSDCVAAVIHSRGRLDYSGVAAAFDGDFRGRRADYREHADQLDALSRVADALHRARVRRGSLELDLPEADVILDEDDPRRVRAITARRGSEPIKRAYNLVEELMVAANEAVGRMFSRAEQPTIWRVHPPPDGGALAQLCRWLGAHGIKASPQQLREPRGMAAAARRIQKHRAAHPLSFLLLRTLKQASYHVENKGHFGLASAAYLHFTSPIRRYPDLHVHRLTKRLLRRAGRPAGGRQRTQQATGDALQRIAREASARERLSLEVERAVHSIYAASLMRDRIGDEALARVVGMTSFGCFANLGEPFVDGLVRFASLREGMAFDPDLLRAVGRRSGRTISLGDTLRVRVSRADVIRRQVDLELVGS